MIYWLYPEWWQYVLDDSRANKEYGPCDQFIWIENYWFEGYARNPLATFINYLDRCECRAKGHPAGVVWYSNGLEPDMHCKGCGEDLG